MKNITRVVVIDNNESITKDIERYFEGHDIIKIVSCINSGEKGLEFVINNKDNIDVIVMDLLLTGMDGLFILSELKRLNINKKVIITSEYCDKRVIGETNNYGVLYFMLKPYNNVCLERKLIEDRSSEDNDIPNDLEARLTELLHLLGIPSHIRGFQYIRDAVMLTNARPGFISYITKDIYPELSRMYNTTPSRVERAIRHAIEVSWTRGDIDLIDSIFGNSVDINRDKPTNSEYISTIADHTRLKSKIIYN